MQSKVSVYFSCPNIDDNNVFNVAFNFCGLNFPQNSFCFKAKYLIVTLHNCF